MFHCVVIRQQFCPNKRLQSVFIVCLLYDLQDRRFSDEIDKLTGYKTKSLLCMPIRNSDGEIIGVAQGINKTTSGELFTEDDEKVISSLYSSSENMLREYCVYLPYLFSLTE